MGEDTRWHQRLNSYVRALVQFRKFMAKENLNELEQQGLIQSFEYTFELAWNLLKDYFEHQGETGILGSRDAIRLAYKRGLISDGEIWMNMMKDRTLSVHTWNEETANQISESIIHYYQFQFASLETTMLALSTDGTDSDENASR